MLCVAASAMSASAQLGQLIAPGPLSKAHAKLEGAANCQKCHTPGRKVMGDQCLACHKPIAERIQAKKGIHRDVTFDCTGCHVEHKGAEHDVRPFDLKKFDHARDTGFPLDGRHAAIGADCVKCHKVRSFFTLSPTCTSCHKDIHNGTLGQTCLTCHPMTAAFKDAKTRFDHSKTAFVLVGAHERVACEKCHVNKIFKGVKFAQCTDCHKSPHRQTTFTDCRSCHTSDTWKTQKIDHAKTAFPLKGKHAELACVKCHTKAPKQQVLVFDKCSRCHQDPHKGTFKEDCSACHTESLFGRAKFDHAKNTKFPLVGKHEPLACTKCHRGLATGPGAPAKTLDFRGLTTTCVSCHTDIHKGQLGQACETCHTSSTFRLPNYVHPRSSEFFGGKHASLPCASCHFVQPPGTPRRPDAPIASWTFKNLPTACASCHADVHLGQVGAACETCHKIDAANFAAITFAHTRASYQLTGRHQSVECRKCHKPETAAFPAGHGTAVRLKGLPTTCSSCHKDQHLGQLGAACESCHTTATFKIDAYKHSKAASEVVTGKHATLKCAECHKPRQFDYPAGNGTTIRYKIGQACLSCHADQHQGALGTSCETCHTPAAWRTVSRAFHKTLSFKLEGRHLDADCAACHWNGVIKGTPTKCYDCHWIRRQDDPYKTRLGNDCESCHRPVSWTAVNWNHGTMTGVALSPAHRALGCAGCHKSGTFTAGGVTCYSCHTTQYQSTASPNHLAAGFPTTCELCHRPTQTTWDQATFTHTTFQLVGTHAAQPCASCHKNGVYQGTSRACVGCHKADYDRSANPNHAAAGFSTTCDACHSATAATWNATYNHTAVYPLVGVHATQACSACHVNNVYHGTSRVCVGCHKTTYDRTTNPGHAAAGFSTTCDSCHSATAATWSASFNHATVYPLVGVHATQACATCHVNTIYPGTPSTCVGCHKTNFDRTTTPNHAAAGYPTTCDQCHSASAASWTASFSHNAVFPLVGVHATQPCAACHVNNVYHGTSRDCVGCHKTNYDRTTTPNHAAAGYPTTCDQCHSSSSATWTASFNHASVFPLVGIHSTQPCAACHKNNVYPGTPTTCVGCHLTNYNATTTPKHSTAGYPTTCDQCHSASAATWTASFNHASLYPLVGVHATQACAACHKNNVYPGTPTTCVGCHLTNYNATTTPNHAAAGFSTACDTCHSNSAATWTASFDHSKYFVLAGRHLTAACTDCHKNNVYPGTPTACYPCHQANYNATTTPNHASAGFPTTCDTCHKFTDASWTLAVFNHTALYPLVGVHATQACAACHKNNVYPGTPTTCVGCHLTNYNATTNPSHAGAGFTTACDSCHKATDPLWTTYVFNHTWFPITSGRHAGHVCSDCHNNPASYAVFSCLTCHAQATIDNSHRNRSGYRYDSAACYSCHPRGSAG